MRTLNLMPKKSKRKTMKWLNIQLSACSKWLHFHENNIIRLQAEQISNLESLLKLHGIFSGKEIH
jgi:hypothetical protein